MARVFWHLLFAVAFGGLGTLTGCSSATSHEGTQAGAKHDDQHGHDEHEHEVETLAEAVAAVTKLHGTMRDAFNKKDHDAADEALHEVGHVLADVPGLLLKAQLPKAQNDAVKQSSEELFNLFSSIDKKMHGGEGVTFAEAAAKLETSLAALQQAAQPSSPAVAK